MALASGIDSALSLGYHCLTMYTVNYCGVLVVTVLLDELKGY